MIGCKTNNILPNQGCLTTDKVVNQGRMEHDSPPQPLNGARPLAEALAAVLASEAPSPLLDAADLLIAACVRAARLYPEWAEAVDRVERTGVDRVAQYLVAASIGHVSDIVAPSTLPAGDAVS
jgi:hypothetical protein